MTTVATDIHREALKHEAAVQEMIPVFNESTGATWLWASSFGPLYFMVHGMWLNILITFVIAFFSSAMFMAVLQDGVLTFVITAIFMWVVQAVLAYRTWRQRAERKANNMAILRG